MVPRGDHMSGDPRDTLSTMINTCKTLDHFPYINIPKELQMVVHFNSPLPLHFNSIHFPSDFSQNKYSNKINPIHNNLQCF